MVSFTYSKQNRIIHHDNRSHINGTGYGNIYSIRVPRLSASDSTWKRFYKLFPSFYEKMLEKKGPSKKWAIIAIERGPHQFEYKYLKVKVVKL